MTTGWIVLLFMLLPKGPGCYLRPHTHTFALQTLLWGKSCSERVTGSRSPSGSGALGLSGVAFWWLFGASEHSPCDQATLCSRCGGGMSQAQGGGPTQWSARIGGRRVKVLQDCGSGFVLGCWPQQWGGCIIVGGGRSQAHPGLPCPTPLEEGLGGSSRRSVELQGHLHREVVADRQRLQGRREKGRGSSSAGCCKGPRWGEGQQEGPTSSWLSL